MSARGPLWTRARLGRVMALRFGATRSGRVDTAVAAAAMGVSRRTVQRWLHAAHGRSLAHIPARRLEQLIALLLPSQETRARQAQQARYAAKAIAQLADETGVKPAWQRQRWTEPHLVAVIEVRLQELRIRQFAVGRLTPTKRAEVARRGRVADQAVVPSRFHATVLTHLVLTKLAPWRFQAGQDQVLQGYTQAWTADAPRTNLADVLTRQGWPVTDTAPAAPSRR